MTVVAEFEGQKDKRGNPIGECRIKSVFGQQLKAEIKDNELCSKIEITFASGVTCEREPSYYDKELEECKYLKTAQITVCINMFYSYRLLLGCSWCSGKRRRNRSRTRNSHTDE